MKIKSKNHKIWKQNDLFYAKVHKEIKIANILSKILSKIL